MGVEEVQKINTLAKELLKHHIASSSEDAYERAEQMVKGETPKADKEDEINRELRTIGLKLNSLYSDMIGLQNEFKLLKEEVVTLRRRVESQPTHMPSPVQEKKTGIVDLTGKGASTEASSAPPTEAPKKTETRLRTGDFQEKDVEIEKFFYYGKNR